MNNDLLVSLRKYRPREGKDSLENFVTESFVWILKNNFEFSKFFLHKILQEEERIEKHTWSSQIRIDGKIPDMVCEYGDNQAIIFENKVWSPLAPCQIDNYRSRAEQKYRYHKLVIITANKSQHDQNPDIAKCWEDIYKIIEEWLSITEDKESFIFSNFLNLLNYEGLGPAAPVSHQSIQYYYIAKPLENNLNALLQKFNKSYFTSLLNSTDEKELYCEYYQGWGRIGFDVYNRNDWFPNVFVGVHLNGADHKCILDRIYLVFIIDFNNKLLTRYQENPNFKAFVAEMSDVTEKFGSYWELYNHLEAEEPAGINPYHPIHLRKPLLEVLRGTNTTEDQIKSITEEVDLILPKIVYSENFIKMRKEFKECLENLTTK